MLNVSTPEETLALIRERFFGLRTAPETVGLDNISGRTPCEDIHSGEALPAFNRSQMDGYALRASDTFGATSDLPMILTCIGEVPMGGTFDRKGSPGECAPGECIRISTGGSLPVGADAVVMIEHTEDYGDGTVGVLKSVAPGQNYIPVGADISKGELLLEAGTVLRAHNIGALAALGITEVSVFSRPVVGILSTGDELVSSGEAPGPGQIRDSNTDLLGAAVKEAGAEYISYGICRDRLDDVKEALKKIADETDMVVLSGSTSAGHMDVAFEAISELGQVHLHGVNIKPGKPTIIGEIHSKPVFALPGNPLAAYFVFHIFVLPLLINMYGKHIETYHDEMHSGKDYLKDINRKAIVKATLSTAVPSNHGREEYVLVKLIGEIDERESQSESEVSEDELKGAPVAEPVASTSGLITRLARVDGYIRIPQDSEGLSAGANVKVVTF